MFYSGVTDYKQPNKCMWGVGKRSTGGVRCGRGSTAILYRAVSKSLSKKVTIEHSSEDVCREPHRYLGYKVYLSDQQE